MYTDAHVHLYDIFLKTGREPDFGTCGAVCASSHGKEEFLWQERLRSLYPDRVFLSFGIHPQEPDADGLPFLETLAREGRLAAIGEAGFDAWNETYRAALVSQGIVWEAQLELARAYGLPLVVHCRKALNLIFSDSARLARLAAVVFHGWPGSAVEARSMLGRGVNAFFSAGKGLLRGDKSLAATVVAVGPDRVLAETDAPWMTLRGEDYSMPADIVPVHGRIAELWSVSGESAAASIAGNFFKVYGTAR